MNDENFDKIFGNKLNEGKDFPFTEAKWQKMENHLDNYIAVRRQGRLWAWLALPLLCLVGLLGWNTWTLNKAQNNIVALTQEVKNLQKEIAAKDTSFVNNQENMDNQKTALVVHDTVYHHIVMKQYDTIFQTVVTQIDKVVSNHPINNDHKNTSTPSVNSDKNEQNVAEIDRVISNHPINNGNKNISTPSVNSNKNEQNDVQIDRVISNHPINNDNKTISTPSVIAEKNEQNDVQIDKTMSNQPINNDNKNLSTPSVIAEKNEQNETQTANDQQKTKRMPIIKPLKFKGFDIGISSGLAVLGDKRFLQQHGFSVGGRGAILLGKRFKIVGEAQYLGLNYETDKLNSSYDIPTIAPPSTNDVFQKVKVQQSYAHYSVGLQYAVLQKRLQPYIGLSVLGQSKLEEKFNFHFKNQVTNEDVFVKTARNNDPFQMPSLRLQLGLEYPIYKKFRAQLESSFDAPMNHKRQFQPLFQLKGAVLYRF